MDIINKKTTITKFQKVNNLKINIEERKGI